MQYLLLLHADEAGFSRMSEEETVRAVAAYSAYTEALKKAGVYVGSNRLKSVTTATTVRLANGKTSVLNGPYAESREQLGGYYLIDTPDLDGAIAWASRCPGASHGAIEIRPVWTM